MKALIVVDVQNDFCPGGALAVKEGDEVVPEINRWRSKFPLVVFTQDWHPKNHGSFASNHPGKKPGEFVTLGGLQQILWPDHCVQKTRGAEFHDDLQMSPSDPIFQKGTDAGIDSYSAFYDNAHRKSTGLADFLRDRKVDEVFVGGLATDYCVLFSALDAIHEGFRVSVIEAACRGVDLQPGDSAAAIQKMWQAGAKIL